MTGVPAVAGDKGESRAELKCPLCGDTLAFLSALALETVRKSYSAFVPFLKKPDADVLRETTDRAALRCPACERGANRQIAEAAESRRIPSPSQSKTK